MRFETVPHWILGGETHYKNLTEELPREKYIPSLAQRLATLKF